MAAKHIPMTTFTKRHPEHGHEVPQSTQIHSGGYDAATQTARICFFKRDENKALVPGNIYDYPNVPPEMWEDFAHHAPSKGKFFGAHFLAKDKEGNLRFPHTKVGDIEPAPASSSSNNAAVADFGGHSKPYPTQIGNEAA